MTAATRDTTPPAEDDFDPRQVPVFPVITVEVVDGGTQLLVDGRTEPVPAETSVPDAAVAAAAEAVRRRGLNHCRVAAVLDGHTYPMVIGADDSRYDTSTDTTRRRRGTAARDRSRAWVVPVAVMVLAVLTAFVAVYTVHQFRRPHAAAPPSATAPAATELPVLPPNGWTTHADWSTPVAAGQHTTALPAGGSLLTVGDDDAVVALEVDTGATRWRTELPGGTPVAGPVRTVVDGVPAAAVATSHTLAWWALTDNDDPATSTPAQVPLPAQAKVSFAGSSPLVVLPGQQAAVLEAGQLATRTVPAGADAVRADGPAVTAVDGRGQIWRIDTDAPHVPDPAAALEPPTRHLKPTLLGTAGDTLVVGWRGRSDAAGKVAVTDLNGHTLASRAVSGLRNDWHADGQIATTGAQLITLDPVRIVPIADPAWRTTRIVGGTVYGTVRGGSATLDRDGHAHAAHDPAATPPHAVDQQHAYVVADTPAGARLYALQPR